MSCCGGCAYDETRPITPHHSLGYLGPFPFCAFKGDRPIAHSESGWQIFKGKLPNNLERKLVVKAKGGTGKAECSAEVAALDLISSVLSRVPELREKFCVVATSFAVITEKRSKNPNVVEYDYVLIQDRVDGLEKEQLLWSLDTENAEQDLSELALAVYHLSGKAVAVSGIRGLCKVGRKITSVTMDSVNKCFGPTDKGSKGVQAFRDWVDTQSSLTTFIGRLEDIMACDSRRRHRPAPKWNTWMYKHHTNGKSPRREYPFRPLAPLPEVPESDHAGQNSFQTYSRSTIDRNDIRSRCYNKTRRHDHGCYHKHSQDFGFSGDSHDCGRRRSRNRYNHGCCCDQGDHSHEYAQFFAYIQTPELSRGHGHDPQIILISYPGIADLRFPLREFGSEFLSFWQSRETGV